MTAVAAIAVLLPSCSEFEPIENSLDAETEGHQLSLKYDATYYFGGESDYQMFSAWLDGENGRHLSFLINADDAISAGKVLTPVHINYDIPYSSDSRDYSQATSTTGTIKIVGHSKSSVVVNFDNFVFTYTDKTNTPRTVKLNGNLSYKKQDINYIR